MRKSMGCFLGCFGSDNGRSRKPKRKSPPRSPSRRNGGECLQQPLCQQLKTAPSNESILLGSEDREKPEILCVNVKKRVTFDLDVNTYIEASAAIVPILEGDGEQGREEEGLKSEEDLSALPRQVSFPENHRYQNCAVSDDEEEEEEEEHGNVDEDLEESDLEDYGELEYEEEEPEESQESCFSLPLDAEQIFDPISPAISTATGARDRSHYVHSVLNPVENLSQWKEVKAKPSSTIGKPNKENIGLEESLDSPPFSSEEPTFKSPKPKGVDKLVAKDVPSTPPPVPAVEVDASLSTWLVSPSQDTKTISSSVSQTSSYSPRRYEDRPILGVLTVEQIKSTASSSPRRSPSKSPDDIPIVGTVGRYWSHQPEREGMNGIPNTTSKYREDKRVNWHSTPFQTRLEKALIEP